MFNFSTHKCPYCGYIGGTCKKPECLAKRLEDEKRKTELLNKIFEEKAKPGERFAQYDFPQGKKVITAEYDLQEIREDSKTIHDDMLEVKGIFKQVGTDDTFLLKLTMLSTGETFLSKI